ncbi:hypothetical protein C8Q77DRAFT_517126 [Trametes polyzona]|nr:hypothetical protein C8Q77DRAFT_517126 [Trametes polyzona]
MTIAGSPVVMTVGTTGMPETIVTVMIVTKTIATGTTAGMTVVTAGIAPGRLLAAVKPMIVAPGLHLPGGMSKTEGLQGTMIGEAAMMTGEALTPIMTAAGTITTGAGTTVAGTRRTIVLMTGPRGTPTETTVGRADLALVSRIRRCAVVVVDREISPQKASWTGSRIESRRICSCCMERWLVLRARRLSRYSRRSRRCFLAPPLCARRPFTGPNNPSRCPRTPLASFQDYARHPSRRGPSVDGVQRTRRTTLVGYQESLSHVGVGRSAHGTLRRGPFSDVGSFCGRMWARHWSCERRPC